MSEVKACGHGFYTGLDKETRKHLRSVRYRMFNRCDDPKSEFYSRYGGRGISVCKEWRDCAKCFFDWCLANGWGEGKQIDRIDNDGNYEPSNCRFVNAAVNGLNRSVASPYGPGVHPHNHGFAARIRINGRKTFLGTFATAEEASNAYRTAFRQHYGEECPV